MGVHATGMLVVISLGVNLLSVRVERQLSRASGELNATSERLSSGQRINRGSDDAAGLSIATSLHVNSRIFSQGIRNLNDGISAVSIAEGATEELAGIAIRIEELASQAATGTLGAQQREALQNETTALQAEWNRIVESTSFNGTQLLTGDNTRLVLQGGKGDNGTLELQIGQQALAGAINNLAGQTTRVNTSSSGTESNNYSYAPSISPDGRYVTFFSNASNLVSGDTNNAADIFSKDTSTGVVTRVNTSSTGQQATSTSTYFSPSADGRYVAFASFDDNIVIGDNNGRSDVFVKDMLTGSTTRISTGANGEQGNGNSSNPSISADGRFVAFSSGASNLVPGDTNAQGDVFVKDLLTGTLTLVSVDATGAQGNSNSFEASISADGRRVVFGTNSTNFSTDTNGTSDIYLKDFVSGELTLLSKSAPATTGNAQSRYSSISADGRFAVFQSSATNLVGGDSNGQSDIFAVELDTGFLSRVSTGSAGDQGNQGSVRPSISADGRYIAFSSSATNLVAGDTNNNRDVFVKDRLLGTLTRVSTTSSGAEGNNYHGEASISADGRYVAFSSRSTNLISGDTNGQSDIFVRDLRKAGLQTMAGMVVNNAASAKVTLELARRYREELGMYRANLGAASTRIQTFINTLHGSRLSYDGAYSRIVDADIGAESSKAIALSIRQKVAASLAAQANQAPRLAVDLLRNT